MRLGIACGPGAFPLTAGGANSHGSPAFLRFPWFIKASLFMLQRDCLLPIPVSESGRSQARREPAGSSPGRSAECSGRARRGPLCTWHAADAQETVAGWGEAAPSDV